MAQKPEVTEWGELLEATRCALTTLQLEDLEALAVRAEQLLQATASHQPFPPSRPRLSQADRRKLASEQRLLGSLLAATDSNLAVLRHLRGSSPTARGSGGLDSRWVR